MSSKVYEGKLIATGKSFAIIVSRFNEFISSHLLSAAKDCLIRHGASENQIEIAWVPGAMEIPVTASRLGQSKKYDAVICLGCVIRGSTPHFDYVAGEVSKGVAQCAMTTGIPTIFGVLTTDTLEQAIERAGTKAGNKGWDAAMTAIEMVSLSSHLKSAGF